MDISARLAELDITLPKPWTLPPGLDVAFDIVVVSRGQAWLAGHGPVDGSDMLMSGVVGRRRPRDTQDLALPSIQHELVPRNP